MADQKTTAPPQAQPQPRILMQIAITMDENQQVMVTGNIENMMMAFGLMEAAKVAIVKMQDEQQKRVQIAPAGLAGMFKRDS